MLAPRHRFLRALRSITVLIAVAAVLVFALPDAAGRLILDRAAVAQGELWRCWSGHLVHFGADHLGWNLLVLLVAGLWLEQLAPQRYLAYWLAVPPLLSLAVLASAPDLARYGGLSGLVTGLVVGLALRHLESPGPPRNIGLALLAVVAGKVLVESLTASSIMVDGLRVVPVAHLAGAVGGLVFVDGTKRPKDQGTKDH